MYALDAVEGEKLKALEGPECKIAQLDVTSPESIERFKKSLGDEPVDLLLNIAGKRHMRIRLLSQPLNRLRHYA